MSYTRRGLTAFLEKIDVLTDSILTSYIVQEGTYVRNMNHDLANERVPRANDPRYGFHKIEDRRSSGMK
jgi:hypothetical protein